MKNSKKEVYIIGKRSFQEEGTCIHIYTLIHVIAWIRVGLYCMHASYINIARLFIIQLSVRRTTLTAT